MMKWAAAWLMVLSFDIRISLFDILRFKTE